VLQGLLVTLGDHLGKRDLVLHGREPELRNTVHRLTLFLLGLLLSFLFLFLFLILLSSLDLLLGRLNTAVDYCRTTLIQRSELAEVLLLKFQDFLLELSLELGVLLLDTLQAGNAAADGRRERFDVAGRATDELT